MQIARRRHRHDFQPFFVQLARIELDLVGDDHERRILATIRIQAEGARAPGDQQTNVTVLDVVPPTGLDDSLHHLGVPQGHLEQNRLCGPKQPVNVLLELEDPAVIGANPFKDAVAVEQAVVEYRDLRVLLVVIFPVDVDFHALKSGVRLREAGAGVQVPS